MWTQDQKVPHPNCRAWNVTRTSENFLALPSHINNYAPVLIFGWRSYILREEYSCDLFYQPSQVGTRPSQFPEARHLILCGPTSLYPSLQVKFAIPPNFRSFRMRCPFTGEPGSSHLTAARGYHNTDSSITYCQSMFFSHVLSHR